MLHSRQSCILVLLLVRIWQVKRVTASVDDELWGEIDQMAREQGRSVSSMVAALLALAVFPGGRIVPPVVDRRSARGVRKPRVKKSD